MVTYLCFLPAIFQHETDYRCLITPDSYLERELVRVVAFKFKGGLVSAGDWLALRLGLRIGVNVAVDHLRQSNVKDFG